MEGWLELRLEPAVAFLSRMGVVLERRVTPYQSAVGRALLMAGLHKNGHLFADEEEHLAHNQQSPRLHKAPPPISKSRGARHFCCICRHFIAVSGIMVWDANHCRHTPIFAYR